MSTLDTNTVLAALFENDTTGGTYLTTNGGTSWNKKWGIPNTVGTLTRACLIRPGSNTEFYMGIDQSSATGLMGVYRTTDGGATWVDFSGGLLLNTYHVRALAFKSDLISPTLYAGAANTTLGAGRGVFEYTFPSTVSLVWSEQTSGTPQILYSISAADNNNVWACGAAGVVSRTTNVFIISNYKLSGNTLPNCGVYLSTVVPIGICGVLRAPLPALVSVESG